MSRRLRTPCGHPGCPRLAVSRGRCEVHLNDRRRSDRDYKMRRSDVEEQAFYKSERWRRLRAWKLRQNPICEICNTAAATIVDHIRPIKKGGDPMLVDNLQSVCAACHNRKHGRE